MILNGLPWKRTEIILLFLRLHPSTAFGTLVDYDGYSISMGFPGSSDGRESAGSVRDLGSIPGLGRSSGGGHGNPLQYSCLQNAHWTEEPGGLQSMGLQRVRHD